METVKVEIQKLQQLNDRLAQTIESLNQVRQSVLAVQQGGTNGNGITQPGGHAQPGGYTPYGMYNPIGYLPGPFMGFGPGFASPYSQPLGTSPYSQPFGPSFSPLPHGGGLPGMGWVWQPSWQPRGGHWPYPSAD